MQQFEYKVVPAPDRGMKIKGLKTPADRYARAVSDLMNQLSQDGWEYWRAETLPSEERKGLTGSITVYHNLLVFRRPSAEVLAQAAQGRLTAPAPAPVMATALSAGDDWPNGAPARTVALTAGTTAALAAPVAPSVAPTVAPTVAAPSVAPPPVAAAPVASFSPHAPEGRTPGLSAQRKWFPGPVIEPDPAHEQPPAAAWADESAGESHDVAHPTTEETAAEYPAEEYPAEEYPPHAPDAGEPVRNLFYGSDDDDEPADRTKDRADTDDTPPSR